MHSCIQFVQSLLNRTCFLIRKNGKCHFGNYEVWDLMVLHGNHKTYTPLLHIVVCFYVERFRQFHSEILKIYAIFQYLNLQYTTSQVSGVLFEYFENEKRRKILSHFIVSRVLSNITIVRTTKISFYTVSDLNGWPPDWESRT